MAGRNSVFSELGFGTGSEIIKVLAHAVGDLGGNKEHLARILSEEQLLKTVVDPLVLTTVEPVPVPFHVFGDKLSAALERSRFKPDKRFVETDWGLSRLSPGGRLERRAVLVRPRRARLGVQSLTEDLERHGLRHATLYELLYCGTVGRNRESLLSGTTFALATGHEGLEIGEKVPVCTPSDKELSLKVWDLDPAQTFGLTDRFLAIKK